MEFFTEEDVKIKFLLPLLKEKGYKELRNTSPCSGGHIPLYLTELDYKYNTRKVTDGARTVGGILKSVGSALCYAAQNLRGNRWQLEL